MELHGNDIGHRMSYYYESCRFRSRFRIIKCNTFFNVKLQKKNTSRRVDPLPPLQSYPRHGAVVIGTHHRWTTAGSNGHSLRQLTSLSASGWTILNHELSHSSSLIHESQSTSADWIRRKVAGCKKHPRGGYWDGTTRKVSKTWSPMFA